MEKKKPRDNIIWDNNYYDIWNPIISDVEDNDELDDNYLLNLKTNDYSHKEYNEELSEKRYKLRVNLLRSKISNNSINLKINKKLSMSHVKSIASTNSSSLINCDNENKIRSNIFSYSKDINNNTHNRIHVNTIHKKNNSNQIDNNKSMVINRTISLSSKNVDKELKTCVNNNT